MIRRISALILAFCLALPQLSAPAYSAATLLPNGEQCFAATTSTSGASGTGNGFVGALGTITAGTGGTSGTYGGVALTGGSGTGATANITVSGGGVTAVAILNPGTQYVVGDTLSAASANIGNTSGFSVVVNSVSINSALAGGQVFMYQPGTSTFKQTWFNADQASTHQNTNPVKLDVNGCAIIYGTGSYRQVLQDSLGNTIWDQVTTDTSANNNTFWAGTAGGTPNAITVTDAGFNGTDGSIIQFTPIANNSGPTTLNPSNYFGGSPPSIVKDTASGPVALSGGEIAITPGGNANVVSVVWSASQANFHLLNLISAASSSSAPLCGAVGLKITNDTTFPNSKVNITADQIVMQTTKGQFITRGTPASPVSVSINFTTNGAGGFDNAAGTSFAASGWYNFYAIDNGIAATGLGSISATAPTMPSGYSYACRLGVMATDASSNFYRFLQLGNTTQYVNANVTNNAGVHTVIIGTGGSNCVTGTISWEALTIQGATPGGLVFVPPTSTDVEWLLLNDWNGGGATGAVNVAPNLNYGNASTTSNPPPMYLTGTGEGVGMLQWMKLESSIVYYCSSSANAALAAWAFKDKINAN